MAPDRRIRGLRSVPSPAEVRMSPHIDARHVDPEQSRKLTSTAEPPARRAPVKLTSRQVAQMAETFHGFKGKKLVAVDTVDGQILLKGEAAEGDVVLFEVETPLEVPDRLRLEKVVVKAEGCAEFDSAGIYDSLFWTESAIEKFVLPYYVAQRVLTDDDMAALKAGIRSKEVVGLGHLPSTHESLIRGIDPAATTIKVLK